jgi:hypothetical protein
MSIEAYPRISGIGLVLISAMTLAFAGWQLRNKVPAFSSIPVARTTTSEYSPAAHQLPFSFEAVLQYFEMSLGQAPTERSANHVIFTGGRIGDGLFAISAAGLGSDVLVKFTVTDDYGMSLVREFFEAPFFQWSESEQLYVLLYMGDGLRWLRLPRFDVVFEFATGSENTTVALLFAPQIRYVNYERPELSTN